MTIEDQHRVVGASDDVNHPSHYQNIRINQEKYEVQDIGYSLIDDFQLPGSIGAAFFNVNKYLLRFPYKHPSKMTQDLNKARFYLNKMIDRYELIRNLPTNIPSYIDLNDQERCTLIKNETLITQQTVSDIIDGIADSISKSLTSYLSHHQVNKCKTILIDIYRYLFQLLNNIKMHNSVLVNGYFHEVDTSINSLIEMIGTTNHVS